MAGRKWRGIRAIALWIERIFHIPAAAGREMQLLDEDKRLNSVTFLHAFAVRPS
jgi:hypothetical protein